MKSTMRQKHKPFFRRVLFVILSAGLLTGSIQANGQTPDPAPPPPPGQGPGPRPNPVYVPIQSDTTRQLHPYFMPMTGNKKAPDAQGFIQRWLVLEPVKKDIARNNIFTDTYLRTTFASDNFSNDFTIVPKKGDSVTLGTQTLKWHALDSRLFNFKLYRFSYAINKPQNGVLFWVVTVINCPEEIKNVRLAGGCNSSGMFWLNGKEALMVSGDKDMVVDNCTSPRLTLKKGKNIIRGAIINGPGMIDFCLRFLDENGQPFKNFTITTE